MVFGYLLCLIQQKAKVGEIIKRKILLNQSFKLDGLVCLENQHSESYFYLDLNTNLCYCF